MRGLDPTSRARHQDMFLMEETDIIVATIAFGMGIESQMSGLLSITIFQNLSRVIIKKRDEQEEMVE